MISKQLCQRAESSSVSGSRMARFKFLAVYKITSGLSNRMAWYFPRFPAVILYPLFCSNKFKTWCSTNTVVGYPKVNFSASCKISQVAATAQRHGGHSIVM